MSGSTFTMNVSLTERLKKFVDAKVSSGIYGSASEFVREAIREKLLREEGRSALGEELVKGLDSGEGILFDDEYIERKKREILDRRDDASGAA